MNKASYAFVRCDLNGGQEYVIADAVAIKVVSPLKGTVILIL